MNQHIYLGISNFSHLVGGHQNANHLLSEWVNRCRYLSTQQSFSHTTKYSQIPETKQQNFTIYQTTCKSVHAGRGTWHHWDLQSRWVDVSLVYIRFPGGFFLQTQWKGEASRSRFHTCLLPLVRDGRMHGQELQAWILEMRKYMTSGPATF